MFDVDRRNRHQHGNSHAYDTGFYTNMLIPTADLPKWVNDKLLAQVRAGRITYRFALAAQKRYKRGHQKAGRIETTRRLTAERAAPVEPVVTRTTASELRCDCHTFKFNVLFYGESDCRHVQVVLSALERRQGVS